MLNWNTVIGYASKGNPAPDRRVEKTDEQWAEQLTSDQFQITRRKGTERAFSGEHCGIFKQGRYAFICCDEPLFNANEKFDSGSGWPSFTQPLKDNVINYIQDTSHGMHRVEVTCSICDSHLGHVFPDGPEPTGLRYCINSLSLKAVDDE